MQATSGEFEIIDRLFRSLGSTRDDVVLGVGDDAALLAPESNAEVCVASAWSNCDGDAQTLARSLFARACEALTAQQATPAWATLSLTVPTPDVEWLAEFSSALSRVLSEHDVALVGGDTTGGSAVVLLALLGPRA